jgi:hypothetical protein
METAAGGERREEPECVAVSAASPRGRQGIRLYPDRSPASGASRRRGDGRRLALEKRAAWFPL